MLTTMVSLSSDLVQFNDTIEKRSTVVLEALLAAPTLVEGKLPPQIYVKNAG